MTKVTIEDLKRIKEKTAKEMALRMGKVNTRINVHMGDSGIIAGAREVLTVFLEELEKSDRKDIRIGVTNSIEESTSEPNVSVEKQNESAVLYGNMNAEKARQVFKGHVLDGKVIEEYLL